MCESNSRHTVDFMHNNALCICTYIHFWKWSIEARQKSKECEALNNNNKNIRAAHNENVEPTEGKSCKTHTHTHKRTPKNIYNILYCIRKFFHAPIDLNNRSKCLSIWYLVLFVLFSISFSSSFLLFLVNFTFIDS